MGTYYRAVNKLNKQMSESWTWEVG